VEESEAPHAEEKPMSRPQDARLNRSGYGELSETDQKPLTGQDALEGREGHRARPDEQTRGHDHDDPDRPDEVHPALKVDDTDRDDTDGEDQA
jgi:hypothetical protein